MDNQFYDSYWRSGKHPGVEWDNRRLARVFKPVLGTERLLDYGCGLGLNYQELLARSVGRYTGADVSRVALDDLRAKGHSGLEIRPDGSVDAPDGSFTAVVCMEVLEHLFDPLAATKEIYRLLTPKGTLVATVPNFGYHTWRLMALLRARVPSEPENAALNRYNGVHIRYFSTGTFKRLFRDSGFGSVEISSFDDSTIWDIFRGLSHLSRISDFARARFPSFMHLRWLQDVCPSVFAYRIRAVARK